LDGLCGFASAVFLPTKVLTSKVLADATFCSYISNFGLMGRIVELIPIGSPLFKQKAALMNINTCDTSQIVPVNTVLLPEWAQSYILPNFQSRALTSMLPHFQRALLFLTT
jgi:hypothetical protein